MPLQDANPTPSFGGFGLTPSEEKVLIEGPEIIREMGDRTVGELLVVDQKSSTIYQGRTLVRVTYQFIDREGLRHQVKSWVESSVKFMEVPASIFSTSEVILRSVLYYPGTEPRRSRAVAGTV